MWIVVVGDILVSDFYINFMMHSLKKMLPAMIKLCVKRYEITIFIYFDCLREGNKMCTGWGLKINCTLIILKYSLFWYSLWYPPFSHNFVDFVTLIPNPIFLKQPMLLAQIEAFNSWNNFSNHFGIYYL